MQKEAQEYVRKCNQCQRFAPNIHQPEGVLNPLSSPWPFAQWGLDIVGPFPKALGNKNYLLVGTDYFTKWVEAELLANIRDVDVKRFIWKNIVTRFRVPHTLISDNGLQFDSKAFRQYYSDLGIKNRYSTPAYPQGNWQAEAINKVIVNGLRRKGKMGGRVTTCLLDVSNNASTVNKRDPFLNDIWSRGHNPSRNWLLNVEN